MTQSTAKKNKAVDGGKIRWKNMPRNWLHQAITYMDKGEMIVRIVVECLETLACFCLIRYLTNADVSIHIIMLSWLFIHTFNWISNGNIWALLIFTFPHLRNRGEKETCKYLNEFARRLGHSESITGICLYGSISRNVWHERSDIDIRILRKEGLYNLIIAVLLTMKERWLAMIHQQPLDLFLIDDVDILQRMRSDESPVLLLKNDKRLENEFPNNLQVKLNKLCN